ncbi:type IV pilin protein [Kistimonas asteriae]|uniref:type IV pilin protein n=1 Tax=Kistimonas asteriae TaxID=517724 RepID=UPI001BACBD10|nr:type IV pilin protein [Kistimonas asteriae]
MNRGYTLIELLVVMMIIGILTAIAFPAYNSYVRTASRSDAHITIQNVAVLQERWMAQFNRYTDSVSDLLGAGATSSAESHYTIKIVHSQLDSGDDCAAATTPASPNRRQYTIIATPLSTSQQADADCTCIFMTDVGFRGSSGARTDPADCW